MAQLSISLSRKTVKQGRQSDRRLSRRWWLCQHQGVKTTVFRPSRPRLHRLFPEERITALLPCWDVKLENAMDHSTDRGPHLVFLNQHFFFFIIIFLFVYRGVGIIGYVLGRVSIGGDVACMEQRYISYKWWNINELGCPRVSLLFSACSTEQRLATTG